MDAVMLTIMLDCTGDSVPLLNLSVNRNLIPVFLCKSRMINHTFECSRVDVNV